MSNKDFETLVLDKLDNLSTDVSWLKQDVWWLKESMSNLDQKVDRLDDKLDDQSFEIKQEVRLQWKYLNQAFDRISGIYADNAQQKSSY